MRFGGRGEDETRALKSLVNGGCWCPFWVRAKLKSQPLDKEVSDKKDEDKRKEQLIAEENMAGEASSPLHCH